MKIKCHSFRLKDVRFPAGYVVAPDLRTHSKGNMTSFSKLKIVLASASPRRQELIGTLGIPYLIMPSLYEEPAAPDERISLPEFVTLLASEKALEVANRIQKSQKQEETALWVLGADTLVTLEENTGKPLGKPLDEADARRMLALLSGKPHFVYTGIALVKLSDQNVVEAPICRVVKTKVRFRTLTEGMIVNYVRTGEPMDKAGAYGAQGFAAPFIESFEGDFFNVVGLPLCELGKLLEECGYNWSNSDNLHNIS